MTLIVAIAAFVLGAWCEHAFDLSGRVLHAWRRFDAWRTG